MNRVANAPRLAVTAVVVMLWAVSTAAQSGNPTGHWSAGPPMPHPRTEVAAAGLAGRVHLVGGFGPAQALLEYDPATERWRERAALPVALHHTTLIGVGDRLYAIGGFSSGWTPVRSVLEYDPADDRWRERAEMPTARGALAVGVIDGRIHAVGGIGEVGPFGKNTGAHEAYDPATDQWVSLAPLPTPRDHLVVAVVGRHLYALGGRLFGNYARNLRVNEVYDPQTNEWRRRPDIPTARSGGAAAVVGDTIFLFGGEAPAGTFDQTEAYDPGRDAWTTLPPMPTARHGLGAVAIAGRIFVVAGGLKPGASSSTLNEVFTPNH
jgi:N-acetylneuraminic acid mutarotase